MILEYNCNLGYPYSYGDSDIDKGSIANHEHSLIDTYVLIMLLSSVFSPGIAFAATGKKVAAESTRAAACAASGACLTLALQKSKCGEITPAVAAFCGYITCLCVEKTAQVISNSN